MIVDWFKLETMICQKKSSYLANVLSSKYNVLSDSDMFYMNVSFETWLYGNIFKK